MCSCCEGGPSACGIGGEGLGEGARESSGQSFHLFDKYSLAPGEYSDAVRSKNMLLDQQYISGSKASNRVRNPHK